MSTAPVEHWIRGIDEPLPPGERLLWQGAPEWRSLAVGRFHARKVAVYFALLIVWRGLASGSAADPLAHSALGALWLMTLGALAVGWIFLFAWLVARTTTYAITDRRLILRIGVALPAVLNVPLRYVEAAACRTFADGTGNLALRLDPDTRVAWMMLWPHARPWRFREPEPELLAVDGCSRVGHLLREALATTLHASRFESTAEAAEAVGGARIAATPSAAVAR